MGHIFMAQGGNGDGPGPDGNNAGGNGKYKGTKKDA